MKHEWSLGHVSIWLVREITSVNGILRKDSIVKIDEITTSNPVRGAIRVTDSLGKIWWVNSDDIINA